jgi:hypothetical protein
MNYWKQACTNFLKDRKGGKIFNPKASLKEVNLISDESDLETSSNVKEIRQPEIESTLQEGKQFYFTF